MNRELSLFRIPGMTQRAVDRMDIIKYFRKDSNFPEYAIVAGMVPVTNCVGVESNNLRLVKVLVRPNLKALVDFEDSFTMPLEVLEDCYNMQIIASIKEGVDVVG